MPESHEYTVTTTFGTSGFAIANEHAEKALLIEISSSVALGDLWEYVFARTSGAHSLVRLQQLLDVPTVHYAVCSLSAITISPATFKFTLRDILHMSAILICKHENARSKTSGKK